MVVLGGWRFLMGEVPLYAPQGLFPYGIHGPHPYAGWQLLYMNMQRLRGGLVFKASRLLYQSTLGLSVIKKMKRAGTAGGQLKAFP